MTAPRFNTPKWRLAVSRWLVGHARYPGPRVGERRISGREERFASRGGGGGKRSHLPLLARQSLSNFLLTKTTPREGSEPTTLEFFENFRENLPEEFEFLSGMRRRVALSTAIALLVGAQLCVAAEVEVAGAGGGVVRRRSLHQPFFPIEWSPPPPMSGSEAVPPPPPAAAASATTGGGRSTTTVMNTVAIALSAGLVALAVASYSCCLLLRRRRREEEDDGDRAAKRAVGAAAAVAARVPSDVGSSSRQHRSPPPSSTASDAIYLDPLTTLVEVRQHEKSPDLRPLPLLKQPSPDLRPLPPLKRPESQPPPPPPSTPPLTTTGYSTDEEDQATYYTAPKTAMSSFSRSTSQHSTLEQTAMPPMAAPAPPQTNPPRPVRPPPPPPPPRQRLLRPLPAESPPPAALANLELTGSPVKPAVEDRGGENSGAARPPKPPHLKPLHWDKLRAISGRTTVWDQVKNSDTFRCAPLSSPPPPPPSILPHYPHLSVSTELSIDGAAASTRRRWRACS